MPKISPRACLPWAAKESIIIYIHVDTSDAHYKMCAHFLLSEVIVTDTTVDSAYHSPLTVEGCQRQWILHRAASLEELWDSMTADPASVAFEDERSPYWTELWPSSITLAQWLHQNKADIASRVCLDVGCGLGLTSMVAAWCGARVIGMDYEPQALHYARQNALANQVPMPLWAVMDWRHPAVKKGSVERVFGGDIMYEKRFVLPVLRFLEHVLAPGGKVWIAEPCRTVYDAFRNALHQFGWTGYKVHSATVDPLYAQPVKVTVHVWELTR